MPKWANRPLRDSRKALTAAQNALSLPIALLRRQIASSKLLPPAYARYRPLLADGLSFFLERLSPPRLERIFLEQSTIPLACPMEKRMVALLHHLPTLHKLGQVLARDRRLDPLFRKELQQLESMEPRTPPGDVLRFLDRELPAWRKAGITLDKPALAEGSVAVVQPFLWQAAQNQPPRRGVFKILKPGIEELLHEDLAIWGALGQFLDEDCERYHLPPLDYQETFERVRDLLVHEVRLDEEQRNLARATREYTGMKSVQIPELWPFCSRQLTAMQRIEGEILTSHLADKRLDSSIANVIARALIAQPLFSSRPAALYHADPHAGNLLLTTDGRLGILDWSLVGTLNKPVRIQLIQLLLGALTQDRSRMFQAVEKLSTRPVEASLLKTILDTSLRQLRWGCKLGIGWLTELLDQLILQGRARFHSDLLLFRKSLLTLEGVLADATGADETAGAACLDRALATEFMRRFLAEWPWRFQRLPTSRHFGTHLSTADLAASFWSIPASFTRYCLGAWLDLAACR